MFTKDIGDSSFWFAFVVKKEVLLYCWPVERSHFSYSRVQIFARRVRYLNEVNNILVLDGYDRYHVHGYYFQCLRIHYLIFGIINLWNISVSDTYRCQYLGVTDVYLLLLFSHSAVSYSLWPSGLQHTRPLCPSPSPRVCSNSCLLVHDAIQRSHHLWSPSSPASNLPQHRNLFQWISSLHQVAKVLGL